MEVNKDVYINKENLEKVLKIMDAEIFMKGVVFKHKRSLYAKKKEEIEFVKDFIIGCYDRLESALEE